MCIHLALVCCCCLVYNSILGNCSFFLSPNCHFFSENGATQFQRLERGEEVESYVRTPSESDHFTSWVFLSIYLLPHHVSTKSIMQRGKCVLWRMFLNVFIRKVICQTRLASSLLQWVNAVFLHVLTLYMKQMVRNKVSCMHACMIHLEHEDWSTSKITYLGSKMVGCRGYVHWIPIYRSRPKIKHGVLFIL